MGYRDGGIAEEPELIGLTVLRFDSRKGDVGPCDGTTVGGDAGLFPGRHAEGEAGSDGSWLVGEVWAAAAAAS